MPPTAQRTAFPGGPPAALSLALVATVFAVDLNLPLGVASAVPYTFAVLLALKSPVPWVGPAVAGLCGLLTVAKMGVVSERGTTEMWKVVANRCLALFSIGMTTFLGVLRRRAEAERTRAEVMIREHLSDLARLGRLATAGQLATGLAHELNQPLAAVCLQADVAVQLGEGDTAADRDGLRAALGEIAEQSRRAADIVRALRRMVRRGEPDRAAVDVNEVVRSVARLLESQAKNAGVAFAVTPASSPAPTVGDRTQLEQVVFNLAQNAIEAAAAAGGEAPAVRVFTVRDGAGRVVVAVRDTGGGLPPGDPERVFEKYFTTKPGGMGMGLAISRSIVEAHGGRLTATPNPDRGATFAFHLPAAEDVEW